MSNFVSISNGLQNKSSIALLTSLSRSDEGTYQCQIKYAIKIDRHAIAHRMQLPFSPLHCCSIINMLSSPCLSDEMGHLTFAWVSKFKLCLFINSFFHAIVLQYTHMAYHSYYNIILLICSQYSSNTYILTAHNFSFYTRYPYQNLWHSIFTHYIKMHTSTSTRMYILSDLAKVWGNRAKECHSMG